MKILTIANEKGGVGKSFIATQFALYCVQKFNLRCCFIDLDQQANATAMLKQSKVFKESKIKSIDILSQGVNGQEVEDEAALLFEANDLLIQLEQQGLAQHGVFAENLQKSLKAIEPKFDLVIIDTNPNPDIRQNAALIACTHLVSPIQLNKESIDGLAKLFERLDLIAGLNPNLRSGVIGMLPNCMEATKFQQNNGAELIKHFGKLLIQVKSYSPLAKKINNKINLVKDENNNVELEENISYAAIKRHAVIAEAQASGTPVWDMPNCTEAWAALKKAFFTIYMKLNIEREIALTDEEQDLLEECKKLYGSSSYKKIIYQFYMMDNSKILVGLNLEKIQKIREMKKKINITEAE